MYLLHGLTNCISKHDVMMEVDGGTIGSSLPTTEAVEVALPVGRPNSTANVEEFRFLLFKFKFRQVWEANRRESAVLSSRAHKHK